MYAVTCQGHGGPDVLTLVEFPKPILTPDQILVRVRAAGLNRADILQRRGKYYPSPGESTILGLEVAGEVVEMGDRVTRFSIGDRVASLVGGGAYAEYCAVHSETAFIIPDHLSYIEAAAIPEAFLTAHEALFSLGNLKAGESVLIHAGASGVGSAAIQLAKQSGATVFTTVGHVEKIQKIKNLGADTIIQYKETDFSEVIGAIHGVDVIIDFIGAEYFSKHLMILKSMGRLICVGMMGGTRSEIDLNAVIRKRLQIKGLVMRTRSIDDKAHLTRVFIEKWLLYFEDKKLCPVIDSVFPLKEVQAAHRYMESQMNVGKIILEPI